MWYLLYFGTTAGNHRAGNASYISPSGTSSALRSSSIQCSCDESDTCLASAGERRTAEGISFGTGFLKGFFHRMPCVSTTYEYKGGNKTKQRASNSQILSCNGMSAKGERIEVYSSGQNPKVCRSTLMAHKRLNKLSLQEL